MIDPAFLDMLASDEASARMRREDCEIYRRRLDEFLGITRTSPEASAARKPESPIEHFLDRIIRGDCLEIMRQMPSASVDLCIMSPPYNLLNSTGNGLKYPK
jgi:hypothetical protein